MTNPGVVGFPAPSAPAVPATAGKLNGGYYYFTGGVSINSSSTLGVGTLRLIPWFVPNACSLSKIGADVASAGESNSLFRLGIYADSGSFYPGRLVLDAGTIAGDSGTIQDIACNVGLAPGWYWVGGAIQNVSVTQPTMRITGTGIPFPPIPVGTTTPSAALTTAALSQTSVTAALPAVFTSTVTVVTQAPRVHVKIA